jgi:hypothetical protein
MTPGSHSGISLVTLMTHFPMGLTFPTEPQLTVKRTPPLSSMGI